jgi:hypothetical protein
MSSRLSWSAAAAALAVSACSEPAPPARQLAPERAEATPPFRLAPNPPARGEAVLPTESYDGDAVFAEAFRALAAEREASFRSALDRGLDGVAQLRVEPFPHRGGDCGAVLPERRFSTEEARALPRLGMVGLANGVALEAVTPRGEAAAHLEGLARAPGSDREAALALQIVWRLESPALLLSAAQELARNPALSAGARRALRAHTAELERSKRFRDLDAELAFPELQHPPSEEALVEALRGSPLFSQRAEGTRLRALSPSLTAAEADALLDDPRYEVRVAAAPAFWKGSDSSAARLGELLGWFDRPEARRQLRAAVVRQRYGLAEEDAAHLGAEPEGFEAFYAKTVIGYVERLLTSAPEDAELWPLLGPAAVARGQPDLTERAVALVARSPRLSADARRGWLLTLLPAAVELRAEGKPAAFFAAWRALGHQLLEAAPYPEARTLERLELDVPFSSVTERDALFAQLQSGRREERALAIGLLASREPAFAAALFDGGLGTAALLARADGRVLGAALDRGVDPRAVAERVLGSSTGELTFSEGEEAYLEALARALEAIPLADRAPLLVRFGQRLGARDALAAEPDTSRLAQLFASIDGAPLGIRIGAWRELLVGADGSLRRHLLHLTPSSPSMSESIAALVRPQLVVQADLCAADPSRRRAGIDAGLIPYVISRPRRALDPQALVSARVKALREATASSEPLTGGWTAEAVFAQRGRARPLYLEGEARTRWSASASVLAEAILTSAEPSQLLPRVQALAEAIDLDALPQARLDQVEALLSRHPLALFVLRVSRGVGYDALARDFRALVRLRWDLADAARALGEQPAMEVLLASVGEELALPESSQPLVTELIVRADVSEVFRAGLLTFAAEGLLFRDSPGAIGASALSRVRAPSLDFALQGAAVRASIGGAPGEALHARVQLAGTLGCDPRLSPAAAAQLAWIALAGSDFDPVVQAGRATAGHTVAIDAVTCAGSRAGLSPEEKMALGRALLGVLPR